MKKMTRSSARSVRTKDSSLMKKFAELYKKGKCKDCSVLVTQMDFAKILGNYSKVKVVFENGEVPSDSTKDNSVVETNKRHNTRLTSNENGMVLIPRKAYKPHPVKEPLKTPIARPKVSSVREQYTSPRKRDKNSNYNSVANRKQLKKFYRLKFIENKMHQAIPNMSQLDLRDLLKILDVSVLPSDDWIVDYLPKESELKKVYDRVEAELEDLMNADSSVAVETAKTELSTDKLMLSVAVEPTKNDISADDAMSSAAVAPANNDITTDKLLSVEYSCKIDSMPDNFMETKDLPSLDDDATESKPVGVSEKIDDKNESVIDTSHSDLSENITDPTFKPDNLINEIEKSKHSESDVLKSCDTKLNMITDELVKELDCSEKNRLITSLLRLEYSDLKPITELLFKNIKDYKVVRLLLNLQFEVEISGRKVTLVGAPDEITNSDDLQVLLEIVNECRDKSFYLEH